MRLDLGRDIRCMFVSLLAVSAPAEARSTTDLLVEGRFGRTIAPLEQPRAEGRPAYHTPPLTIECWTRLQNASQFNILVASQPKSSGTHWELYTYAGDGGLSFHLPDHAPHEIHSSTNVVDDRWHHVAASWSGDLVRLFVDGRKVAEQAVQKQNAIPPRPGPLMVGWLLDAGLLPCAGLVDDVRISHVARTTIEVPAGPLTREAETIGLWSMDEIDAHGHLADASSQANSLRVDPQAHLSIDEVDRLSFKAGPSPWDTPAQPVTLGPESAVQPPGPTVLSLDGTWELAENGPMSGRLGNEWGDAIPATVPGSVHSALVAAGKLPDPKFGQNDKQARDKSFQTWWMRKRFSRPPGLKKARLVFDGVAVECSVWLNGIPLVTHNGMFGGPECDLEGQIGDENTLVVKLAPAPFEIGKTFMTGLNIGWTRTAVFNNVYGWHYSNIPAIGIWRSVRLVAPAAVTMQHPFVRTTQAIAGKIEMCVDLAGDKPTWSGQLTGTIEPENFKGPAVHFTHTIHSDAATRRVHLSVTLPDPHPWWPNGLGPPDLYRLRLSFTPEGGGVADAHQSTFGLRTIEMTPLPQGPRHSLYNWTFNVNGKPMFVKGANWCTMDSSMDFSRARYERYIELARLQHIQILRAWGSGMPETDDFFDLCDRKGIMVMQEWPTAWNSHTLQPFDVLEETIRLNTLRVRNHPSLVMYCGGNESSNPTGQAIDMMGRHSIELDGTRPFHRGEPWGGSLHDYGCYWGRQPLDYNLKLVAPFFGEFGLACMPVAESVQRYLPDDEKTKWPAPPDGTLVHHTPIFNTAQDLDRLMQYAAYFNELKDIPSFVTGSQLSQVVGLRHPLERARTRWPDCSGAIYYKMNDNYPAASWSTVDWYGAPKLGHYFIQDAFTPLHACVLFDRVNVHHHAANWPVFLLDDANELHDAAWQVRVRAFNGQLEPIKEMTYPGTGTAGAPRNLGTFSLTAEQTTTAPLFVVAEITKAGKLVDRTFYFVNYETPRGGLFSLPKTQLLLKATATTATVTNQGNKPAVATAILQPGHLDTFTADDNYFWLDPGESRTVTVNNATGLNASAWNAGMVQP